MFATIATLFVLGVAAIVLRDATARQTRARVHAGLAIIDRVTAPMDPRQGRIYRVTDMRSADPVRRSLSVRTCVEMRDGKNRVRALRPLSAAPARWTHAAKVDTRAWMRR